MIWLVPSNCCMEFHVFEKCNFVCIFSYRRTPSICSQNVQKGKGDEIRKTKTNLRFSEHCIVFPTFQSGPFQCPSMQQSHLSQVTSHIQWHFPSLVHFIFFSSTESFRSPLESLQRYLFKVSFHRGLSLTPLTALQSTPCSLQPHSEIWIPQYLLQKS